ncbi:hypothetical protein P4E94_14580 [Pontiellaceae bacterium B12219]|nr:hypothetical protein [Pontiellaceae bacterium B12219]
MKIFPLLISCSALTHVCASAPINVEVGALNGRYSPEIIGYNWSLNPQDSNVSAFIDYSEANGMRVRMRSKNKYSAPLPQEEIASAKELATAIEAFRKTPPATLRTMWQHDVDGEFERIVESRAKGIKVLACVTYGAKPHEFIDERGAVSWSAAWEYWRRYYAIAFILGENGIDYFQLFNEPDHKHQNAITLNEYILLTSLGSDAAQTAFEDHFPGLKPGISAPATAGIKVFNRRSGRSDTRDLTAGWGRSTLELMHQRWDGKTDPDWSSVTRYAFQAYSRNADKIAAYLDWLDGEIKDATDGEGFPITTTEFNVATAGNYSGTDATQDSPKDYTSLGETSLVMSDGRLDEIFYFRMTQNAFNGVPEGIKKNGTHYTSNLDPYHHIGGTTKAAEVIKLLASSFKNRVPLCDLTITADQKIYALAGEVNRERTIVLAGKNDQESVDVIITSPGDESGGLVVVNEVSENEHGGVVQLIEKTENEPYSVKMPGYGVIRIRELPGMRLNREVELKNVRMATSSGFCSGFELNVGYGSNTTFVYAKTAALESDGPVFLQVETENSNDQDVFLHLYCFKVSEDSEEALPYVNKGVLLKPDLGEVLLNRLGYDVFLGGTVEASSGSKVSRVDITRAINAVSDREGAWGFYLVREPRFSGDEGDAKPVQVNALSIRTTTAANKR